MQVLIINKEMKKILNFIKKECWLACMLVGISLMTWAVSQGEGFVGHIPLACLFIVAGVGMESSNNKHV
jgi:hypothetical protein|tara:strand:+ start:267 stop:473 length:207 start_codon:yes stop_codon:yes gene_type:complete